MTHPLILVGDNSQVVREVLRWHLESHGYRVLEAADGAESVARARQAKPAAILLSVELPILNGHQTLARLKGDPELRDTPVVFITAHTETDDVVEGLRLGAHDYLRKPFEPAEVIARVSAAVRVKELQDDLRARNAELDHIARSDPLTGLANRRHLDEQLAAHSASAQRHHHELSVAVVDIDNFKTVNDTFGHNAGDDVLREVARRIAGSARVEDVVGRWGGEEFIVILPHCGVGGAADVSERIRRAVSSSPVGGDLGVAISVTVSIGCTGGTDDQVIERADAALYAAKNAGRDRTVVLEPPASAQADGPVLGQGPAGIVGHLPGVAVGIDEDAGVATPEGRGAAAPDGGAGGLGLGQDGVDGFGRGDVVGQGDAAPAAAVGHGTVLGQFVAGPEGHDHAPGLEEHDVVVG